ncbi:hypothetical protein ACFC1T_16665 [Kitasatospora sp. NPDC056076]
MRKTLIAAVGGLALTATLLFAATTGSATTAPTSPTRITANEPVKCC